MQTFLPYADFARSADALDDRRLNKQILECRQILNVLAKRAAGEPGGWQNHPAVLMWEGYETALKAYHNVCLWEWLARGFKHTATQFDVDEVDMPPWLGDDQFHRSHRGNLKRKDPEMYAFDDVDGSEAYVWPTKKERKTLGEIKVRFTP